MIKPGIGFHPLFYYGERIRIIVLEMMFFVDCHIEKIDDYSPNDETIQAIKECDTGKGSTRYDSYDDFLKELNT